MLTKASKSQLFLILFSGLFLGFVLYVYEAFGIRQGVSFSGHTLLERVVLFGVNVSFVFAINELIIRPRLKVHSIWQRAGWVIWEIFSAATFTHVLFNYFWKWSESNWYSYFLLLGEFFSVMIIPFGMYFLLKYSERKGKQMFLFSSENGKDNYSVQEDRLLYVKSEDNYVKVVHRRDQEEKAFLIRKKISDVENELPGLVRVHRSYLIMADNVISVEQNNRSMTVHFETGSSVPVSSKYQSSIAKFLTHHV